MTRKAPVRRWLQSLNMSMPVLLDTAGIMLLSCSASLWLGLAAGLAALGVGCIVLNWRFYSGT